MAHRARARGLDGALQLLYPTPTIPAPLLTFEGLSNVDNFNILGGRVNPPDPNGEVGPNNFVEMINLVFAVYDKAGNLLLGPFDTGSLFAGFPVTNCALKRGRSGCSVRPVQGSLVAVAVYTVKLWSGVLELRCDLDHQRSDRLLLPVRVLDWTELSRLPEIRQLDGLLRDHDT